MHVNHILPGGVSVNFDFSGRKLLSDGFDSRSVLAEDDRDEIVLIHWYNRRVRHVLVHHEFDVVDGGLDLAVGALDLHRAELLRLLRALLRQSYLHPQELGENAVLLAVPGHEVAVPDVLQDLQILLHFFVGEDDVTQARRGCSHTVLEALDLQQERLAGDVDVHVTLVLDDTEGGCAVRLVHISLILHGRGGSRGGVGGRGAGRQEHAENLWIFADIQLIVRSICLHLEDVLLGLVDGLQKAGYSHDSRRWLRGRGSFRLRSGRLSHWHRDRRIVDVLKL